MKAFYDRLAGEFAKVPYVGTIVFLASGKKTWTNMPAALTGFGGDTSCRAKVDLTNATQCRINVRVETGGATNAALKVQYSTDENDWSDVVGIVFGNTSGTKVSPWSNIPTEARGDVFLRLVGVDGNGTADPAFGIIVMQVK